MLNYPISEFLMLLEEPERSRVIQLYLRTMAYWKNAGHIPWGLTEEVKSLHVALRRLSMNKPHNIPWREFEIVEICLERYAKSRRRPKPAIVDFNDPGDE